jgi:hypothetical protein
VAEIGKEGSHHSGEIEEGGLGRMQNALKTGRGERQEGMLDKQDWEEECRLS